MKRGLVIGTFGSLPYIHLSLESRKRFYHGVPTLISDDCSPSSDKLAQLCKQYGADFISNEKHMPDHYGDLSVFVNGLHWAQQNNIDLLLKVSRRFIPLFDWSQELIEVYQQSEAATFSNICSSYNFGFRTECVGFHVPTWFNLGLVQEMEAKLNARNGGVFMEGYIHELAQKIMWKTSNKASEWFYNNPKYKGFYPLNFMGTSRHQPKQNLLWHDYTHPMGYMAKCQEFGLYNYKSSDFYLINR